MELGFSFAVKWCFANQPTIITGPGLSYDEKPICFAQLAGRSRMARAPWMKSMRRWRFPRLVIRPRMVRSPVDICFGTKPSQAAKSRSNCATSGVGCIEASHRELLHDRRPDAGSLARINADDVERLVVAVLGRELSRPELLADGPSAGWSAEKRLDQPCARLDKRSPRRVDVASASRKPLRGRIERQAHQLAAAPLADRCGLELRPRSALAPRPAERQSLERFAKCNSG